MSDVVDDFIRETNRRRGAAGQEEPPVEAEPEDESEAESAADAIAAFLAEQEDR